MRYISNFTREKTRSLPSKYKKSVKFNSIKRSQGAFFPPNSSLSAQASTSTSCGLRIIPAFTATSLPTEWKS